MRANRRILVLKLFGLLTVQLLAIRALPHSDHLPNTKSNRWVYVALAGCQQKGLLEFHEGAQFRIYSTASRTDVARAALSAYNLLWWQVKDLQRRIGALPRLDSEASRSELRAKLDALKQEVAGFDAKAPEIRGLLRISNEFAPELRAMGVNVRVMRTFLEDMTPRIGP